MSLNFFLTIYARLAGVTALVILICTLLFNGINSVRHQFWHERFAEPLMRWLAVTPAPVRQYHWMPSMFDLRSGHPGQFELSSVTMERLGYGQVVAQRTGVGYRYLVQSYDGDVISLRLEQAYREMAQAVALIIRWHLETTTPGQRLEVIDQLADALGVSIQPVQDLEWLPDQSVLEGVSESGLVVFSEQREQDARVLLRLSEGDLVVVRMPAPFNSWGWPVIALLLVVVGSVLAIALFLAIRFVDTHLRKVESVAVRIARGEMGARVESEQGTLVSRLAGSFNSMAEHIQRLVEVQREMIHAVSHELRTPVARIRFGVQMIESGNSPEVLARQLDGIDGDIQELDELIDEILTYARLEQGGPVFSLREDSVTDIIRQVVSEQQIIRTGIQIDCCIDDASERWALADVEPRYIHRAIQNLVGNAARYAAGHVVVNCHLDEDNCRIDVEDDGPGIPEQDWEKVFTAFARLDDSRTRTSGGYGLGLSIVRRILYWHGGQAFVGRSDELGGARFSLVWPRRKSVESVL
ncbi:ATP-binding protein [Marinobacter halophilus]|uniref:histidine kinase n=1 Tax=Marinobacter halophilus TaxID=1323740 RepID=A0A2T1KBA0_9GAMM|nr:ATP-binding protein [Marinobacter halophilus]PSF07404.1 two-component sensor histidine kinase [Marinobacter halophilus]GGC81277.1 two-component sensor histidine kinase [Marinobacter halophilus]